MQAVILKKNPFSEGNEIITMFTRELGKVRAVARAVKSSKSKLAFGLQSLFLTDVELVDGKNMSIVKGVRPVKTFKNLREQERSVFAGLYAAEFILKSTADEHPNPELFDYFIKYLEHLDSIPALGAQESQSHICAEFFILHALALTGYGLHYKNCTVCGKELDPKEQKSFSNRKTGFVCKICASGIPDAVIVINDLYDAFIKIDPEDFESADRLPLSQKIIHKFAESFTNYILERNLASGQYLV